MADESISMSCTIFSLVKKNICLRRSWLAHTWFVATFILTACTGVSFQSGDALKSIYSSHVADLRTRYSAPGSLDQAIANARLDRSPNGEPSTPSGTARNALLNDFIFLIDSNYTFYEKHLYNKKAYFDFGSEVTSATLSTLSGIVTGGGAQGAKSILSFVAGGITSTKASVDKDILQSQNLLAIVAKMRAQRADKLIVLQKGMYRPQSTTPTPLSNYSVDQGLVDLATYYQAGTFVSALQAIVDTAGKEKSDSDSEIKNLKGINETPIKKASSNNQNGN
jgi:hypothetical protein